MSGLAPANLRLQPDEPANDTYSPVDVEIDDGSAGDQPVTDDSGNVIQIEHDDGSITISLDGSSLIDKPDENPPGWYGNLATKIDKMQLSGIAEELLIGIEDDKTARAEWVSSRATGIKMLGLKIEVPGVQGASEGAPVEGMSTVRHPLLLEAVLRFQANARAELLPTDGPVKIRNDDNNPTLAEDTLADDLAKDFNHFLTVTDRDYFPDTDRMLFTLGFGGTEFKKGYFCPIKNRPVSEWTQAEDLIINNNAKSIQTAKRVTHRIEMSPSLVRRMQLLGVYRDIELHDPQERTENEAERERKSQQGITGGSMRSEDRDREIYECYCELDVKGFEHRYKGKVSGLPVPYRVTIDVTSREVLALVRDYPERTKELPVRRRTFVQYLYIPGLGIYGIGLLHILGNTTNAITAAWRELLDSGMFANFPGFLIAKSASRQNTNIFRVPPGGGVPVDTKDMPLKDAVMPLPYSAQGMPALMQLVENIAETGQRLGGTAEVQVGEGKQDAPVGTTLALLEQATKIENSVHKRLWTAQSEEIEMLAELFREHPDSFWQQKVRSTRQWDKETFMRALQDYNLVPQADPNTASHTARIIKFMGLKQLEQANPSGYDSYAVDRQGLRLLGYGNPDEFLISPEQQAQKPPPPEVQEKIAKLQNETKDTDAKAGLAAAQARHLDAETQSAANGGGQQTDTPVDVMDAHTRAADAATKAKLAALKEQETGIENRNRDLDRASHEKIAILDLARDVMKDPAQAEAGAGEVQGIEKKIGVDPGKTGKVEGK